MVKQILRLLTLSCVLLLAGCVQKEPDVWGSISGIIKDALTSQPLENVKVTVTSTGASKVTTSDGQFSFDNLDAAEYTLSFEKSGYYTATQTVRVPAGEQVTAQVQLKPNRLGLEVNPASLDFGTDKNSLDLTITATGGKSVRYEVTSSHSARYLFFSFMRNCDIVFNKLLCFT